MLMPKPRMSPLALQIVDRALPAVVVRPRVGPDVELLQVDGRQAEILEADLGGLPDVIGGEDVVERVLGQRRPPQVLRRDLGRDASGLVAMAREHLAEQLLALAVAVRERGVEERAAERDRSLERRERLVVIRSRPAAHAPEAVADFGDGPAESAELALSASRRF